MINPERITDYKRSVAQLEEFLLFCIVVSGQLPKTQALRLDRLLLYRGRVRPFEYVAFLLKDGPAKLIEELKHVKMGQYRRIRQAFQRIIFTDPVTISPQALEKLIGPESAQLFILHSREIRQLKKSSKQCPRTMSAC